ncbi:phosphoadenosine phosphosulfate reductase domain-containing protein [Pseudomonas guariconensis]|uniref:phosphoadenosine phosphosulfate reductase domain-containing protein n=1 Tax=Pseudomonas guariconensis TaxID=1288410 RepID=UPI003906D3E2
MNQLPPIAETPETRALLNERTVVAVGVSGGKDSVACLIAVDRYLNAVGFKGPRLAVHSHLGSVEWAQSLFKCEEAAKSLGWELVVVERAAGGMMERWHSRWNNNVRRYTELSCVQLILPWSTPSMRFCTSELKTTVIRSYLKRTYPDHNILNATGIRREESANRSKMPIAKHEPQSARKGYAAYQWNPIIEWQESDVWRAIASQGLEPHEAYTRYRMGRVSCRWCIMSSSADAYNATLDPAGHNLYREMVELEVRSTFSFQSNKWLADVNPDLLTPGTLERVAHAKAVAQQRKLLEAAIPKHLRYANGWPTVAPSLAEARLLSEIRLEVSAGVGFAARFTDPHSLIERYEELLRMKDMKGMIPGIETTQLIPLTNVLSPQQLSFF